MNKTKSSRNRLIEKLTHELFPYFATVVVLLLLIAGYKLLLSPSLVGLKDSVFQNLVAGLVDVFTIFLLFSIIQYKYRRTQEKKSKISRLQEELTDYKGWTETEAAYRIAGIVRRLRDEGVQDIDLNNVHGGNLPKDEIKAALLNKVRFSTLDKADLEKVSLQGVELFYLKLSDSNLKQSDFTSSDLFESDLQRSNLFRSVFKGTDLCRVNFQGSDLIKSCFKHADMFQANLQDTRLMAADFEGANLEEANLTGAKLYENQYLIINLKSTLLPKPNLFTDMLSSDLEELVGAFVYTPEWLLLYAESFPHMKQKVDKLVLKRIQTKSDWKWRQTELWVIETKDEKEKTMPNKTYRQ